MDLKNQLDWIYALVWKNFTYETDKSQYGQLEKWVVPTPGVPFHGDCEDFVLACREECKKRGIESQIVTCIANGEGHCVLYVHGWIFDNNASGVVTWESLPYTWVGLSGINPGDAWHSIEENN